MARPARALRFEDDVLQPVCVRWRRAGVGLVMAFIVRRRLLLDSLGKTSARALVAMGGLVLTLGGLLWLGIGARAESVLRLSGSGDVGELRVSNLPQVMETVRIYFPLGAGFGTFDPVFRILEPDSSLTRKYFNHAHNDWIELIITGGVPAVLVLYQVPWGLTHGGGFPKRP